MKLGALLIAAALTVSAAFASEPDGKAAFERLKTLAGEWEGKLKDGVTGKVSYEVISGGSAILERSWGNGMPEGGNMVSVYHLDGNRLMMTHYCLAKNQPRLVAKSYDSEKGEIAFEFLDVTNLSGPDDGYISGAVFHLGSDKTRFASDWSFTKAGKVAGTEKFEYTRVR
ncbi:MAG TPA: hypothetical protein VN428_06435 [Bryobacteraceae bacterium]|nr:hypothetical protein [Bryobacteraceae bacterium]